MVQEMSQPRFTIWSFGRNLKKTSPEPFLMAVRTTLNQSFGDWEMFLVSDGSDDETDEWLAPQVIDSRITFISNPERRGKMQNFLDLFPRFSGQIAIELDADDWFYEEGALQKVSDCYGSDRAIQVTVGRWHDPHNSCNSGNIHNIRERRPRPTQAYDALRTFDIALMRSAIERYPIMFIDPQTGAPWHSSADCAIIMPMLHLAERLVDLGHIVYMINDHNFRDHRLDARAQWDTTARIQLMWESIKAKEELEESVSCQT